MGFDLQQAEQCLQSLDLVPLFQTVLGWNPPDEKAAIAVKAFSCSYRARCIAQNGTARVWLIKLKSPAALTVQLKAKLHQAIHKKYPHPLIIFIDQQRCRSLWCWQNRYARLQSQVFISHQPLAGWLARLTYLANYKPENGILSFEALAVDSSELTQQLNVQLHNLSGGIDGIGNGQDRWWYAVVLLQRLIIIQLLQRQGLLNNDIWYLHNQLGRSQQQQPNIFFKQVLQPLFGQGFSLPVAERPRHTRWMGQIPYLGDIFYPHALEQKHGAIDIEDAVFEAILVWFESPLWQQIVRSWQPSYIVLAFEQVLGHWTPEDPDAASESHATTCDLLINQFVLTHLGLTPDETGPDVWDVLFCGQAQHVRQLVQAILPQFSVIDPACGAGSLLVLCQHRLVDIYCALIGHLKTLADSQLQIWFQGLESEHESLLQTIYRRIFKYGLYGVDLNPVAVDSARLQLLLGLIAMARQPQDIEPLPSLEFNIVVGNSLVGFIRVDEAGFDRLRSQEHLLQGNLLQPLVAQSYQTILAEKNIALEYYRSRTHILEDLRQGIPHYAQLEFFREQINNLDAQAQAKLDELLLAEFSQTLGIRFKAAQLMESPRPRILEIEDIAALRPFHWGYHFSQFLDQGQGFNVVISRPPSAPVRPSIQEFFQRFGDVTNKHELSRRTFKSTKRYLNNVHPEVAATWLSYQSHYSLVADYFYRSPQYTHQTPMIKGKRQRTQLRQDWLFIERCFNLVAPQGVCGLIVSNDIKDSPRGMVLRGFLDNQTDATLLLGLPRAQASDQQCCLCFMKPQPG